MIATSAAVSAEEYTAISSMAPVNAKSAALVIAAAPGHPPMERVLPTTFGGEIACDVVCTPS